MCVLPLAYKFDSNKDNFIRIELPAIILSSKYLKAKQFSLSKKTSALTCSEYMEDSWNAEFC